MGIMGNIPERFLHLNEKTLGSAVRTMAVPGPGAAGKRGICACPGGRSPSRLVPAGNSPVAQAALAAEAAAHRGSSQVVINCMTLIVIINSRSLIVLESWMVESRQTSLLKGSNQHSTHQECLNTLCTLLFLPFGHENV